MQFTYLKMALAIVLAWLPALFWLVFAATGIVMGLGGLFSDEPLGGLVFIALGVGGILGFIGLTVACWPRKSLSVMLKIFLFCGVVSLLFSVGYLIIEGEWKLSDPLTLLQLSYFVACPVAFGIYRIVTDSKSAAIGR